MASARMAALGTTRARGVLAMTLALSLATSLTPFAGDAAGATTQATGEGTTTLLVQVDPQLSAVEQEAVITGQGGTDASVIPTLGLHEVTIDAGDAAAALAEYNDHPDVLAASVDETREVAGAATDPEYAQQWALPRIGWEDVHGVATYSSDVTLAVLDTGVDAAAPDLAGRLEPGWSFDGSDPATDANGHGTHTATIAAASADDGVGIAGVAYSHATVMPVKVLGSDGSGNDSDVIAGLVWATDNGADVAVMPFAGGGESAALQAALDYAWANGVVLVAAAGNDGSTTPTYPAGSGKVVGVGASDHDETVWAASNQSDAVFLSAPGVDIAASDATGTVNVTGTSASAALTAGAAAALRAIDPAASNATIVGRLARSADPLNMSYLGNGRLNIGRASTDTSTDGVIPVGAPGGGPVVGPYLVAVARTWTGVASQNFNNGLNWTPNGTPTALDALTIPAVTNSPVVSAGTGNGLAASIVVQSGGNLRVSGFTLTVGSGITVQTGGTLITALTGAVALGTSLTMNGSLDVSGTSTLTIAQDYLGSGSAIASGGTISIGRSWRPTGGSFAASAGTVTFTGPADGAATFAAMSPQFFNVVVNAGADPRFSQVAGSTIRIAGNYTNSNSLLNVGTNATVELNGSGIQTVSSASTGATFGHLVVNKPATEVGLLTNAKVAGDVTVTAGTLDLGAFLLDRTAVGGTFTAAAGAIVEIGGTNTFPANFAARSLATTSRVTYNGTAQTVAVGPYGNLRLTNSGIKTMPATPMTVNGTLQVMMTAVVNAGAAITVEGFTTVSSASTVNAGSFSHHLRGDLGIQSPTFNAGTSTFTMDGSVPQIISGAVTPSFHNLTIANAAGVSLATSVEVAGGGAGGLLLTSGNVTTGANTLTIAATGAVHQTSGHVVGNLRKQISSDGTVAPTYEVGTATSYTPVDLTISGVSGSSPSGTQHLTVTAITGDHPNVAASGIDAAQSVNTFWRMTVGGTWTFTDYDATFGFGAADVDGGADTSTFIVRRNTGGTWFAATAGTRTPTSTESLDNLSFSDFAIGEASGDATTTDLSCPASLDYGDSGLCTATVTTSISGVAPSGSVAFSTDGSGTFSGSGSCTLAPQSASTSTCSVTYTATGVGTGTHQIDASFSDGAAYLPSTDPATIAVNPVALTITADDQSKAYGAFDPVFTFTYGGLTNGDTGAATPPTCAVAGPHEDVSGSPYAIACSGAVDSNYTISYVDGELSVTPVALTITADDQSKAYGALDPLFTFTYAGLTNGDTGAATSPACAVAGPHEDVSGSPYAIACSGAADSNYTISYVDGELSVTPVALTITADDQSKAYGAFDPVFTFAYAGLTNGDTGTATPPTCTVVGPHSAVAGSPYPITCSGAVDPNYTISYVSGDLAVTAVPLTITADNQTKVEGAFDPVFTFVYSGLTNGDTGTATPPTCTVVGPHSTVAGSPYPITCSGAVDPNYTISYVSGLLTVTPAPIAPEVSSIDRADANPTNAATVQWTVTFSASVTGVGVSDFSLSGSGAGGASILTVSADSGSTRTVTAATGTSGTLTLHLDDDDSISDGLLTPLGGVGTGTVGSGGAGNGSFAGQSYTVDKVGPVITITTPPNGASYALNQVVNAAYGCTDSSGVATCAGTVANGVAISTTPVGAKTFTVNATDSLGNPSTLSTSYSVGYAFTGFFSPVNNLPTINSLKSGQAVPVKFSLGGNFGLSIFAAGYPKSEVIACDSTALVDGVEETVTAGGSSLSYDSGSNQYNYVWKTQKSYAVGSCRQLVVKFVDGTTQRANFKFK